MKVLGEIHAQLMIGGSAPKWLSTGTLRRVLTSDVSRVGVIAVLAAGGAALALVILGAALPVLGVALLLPLIAAIARRPQTGVLALALVAPFDGLLQIAGFPTVANAWKETLVGVVLVATFVCPGDARAPRGRSRPGWLPALVGLLVIGLASAAASHDIAGIVGLKVDFFYVLLALAVWRCPLDAIERDRLVTILMGTGIVCAVVGLWQQVVGEVALHNLGYEYNTTIRNAGSLLRSFSTFNTPFAFGFYLMVVILVGVPVALAAPTRLRNRLFLLALPVYILGMLTSVVRASVLGLGIGLAYLGLRRYRVLLLGLPLAFVGVLALGVIGGASFSSFSSSNSFQQRQVGWTENFNQIARHPLGIGIGTTGAAADKAAQLQTAVSAYNPDNYYFKTAYELGVLGLWMFLLFLIGTFVCTRFVASQANPRDGPLLDGVAAMVLAAAAASTVANYFDAFPLDVEFWLLIAIASTIGTTTIGGRAERTRREAASLVV